MNAGEDAVELIGRGERIWTSDPHNPIVVRYQAALRPEEKPIIVRFETNVSSAVL